MRSRFLYIPGAIFIIILLLWFFADKWLPIFYGSFENTKRFGDIFIVFSALFSALAFAGLIVTILIQRRDINTQSQISNIQNFENIFFKLLDQHHRIVDSFVINVKNDNSNQDKDAYKLTRLEAFDFIAKEFKRQYDSEFPNDRNSKLIYDSVFTSAYSNYIIKKYGYMLNHYFRNVYLIVSYINEEKALKSFDERYKYIKILRAQLSAPEINLIAWNGLTERGKDFRTLIENYSLLKNMNLNYEMINLDWLSNKYPHLKNEIIRFFNL